MVAKTVEAHVSHRFAASREQVFDAWLDDAAVREWMAMPFAPLGGQPVTVRRVEIDARVGGRFTFSDMRSEGEAVHWGTYQEIARPATLVFTWFTSEDQEREERSLVTLTIERDGEACVATISHEMDARWTDYVAQTEQGWSGMLEQIAQWLRR